MLQRFRNCIALAGQEIDDLVDQTLASASWHRPEQGFQKTETPYHLTLLTKDELRNVALQSSSAKVFEQLNTALRTNSPRLHVLGIGAVYRKDRCDVFYIVVIWARGQELRRQLGLPCKNFHITLSQSDIHAVDKGVSSLVTPFPAHPPSELLDHLAYSLYLAGDYAEAENFALRLCEQELTSPRGFLRLADVAFKIAKYKLASLSYACSFTRLEPEQTKAQEHCTHMIVSCADYTDWGTVLTEDEFAQLPPALVGSLLEPWPQELRSRLAASQHVPKLRREPREHVSIPAPRRAEHGAGELYRLPRFFRWLVPFRIALMSIPRNVTDIAALASQHIGIRHVLTLTEERRLDEEWFRQTGVKNTYLPIPDYTPPTIEQMDLIVRLLDDDDNLPMLIHCAGGKGRAGTVAACYITAFGFSDIPRDRVLTQPSMTPAEAIAAVRAIRPGSLESESQERFVTKWSSTIWKRQRVIPDLEPEAPSCPLEVEGSLGDGSDLFILVGLPGSGKSWTARALLARSPTGWTWISQDESGSRDACEGSIGRDPRGRTKVILDRCNTSAADRTSFLALAQWARAPVAVWFDYPSELCISRAQNRAGHPTLPPGGRVRAAVTQMQGIFTKPDMAEGFSAVVTIRSLAAANEFVQRVSPPITLLKFPRTPHLLNLGAVTPDDLITPSFPPLLCTDAHSRVIITEKIDGANMGFSLSADRTQILVQNRSHYVNPASHEQFRRLGHWLEVHRADLYKVLDRDPLFAERYILYGEWMAMRHSVAYTKLPDWFVAFDFYDRSTGRWADRQTLCRVLEGTAIRIVPVVQEGQMPSEQELVDMVQRQSRFTDGRVEGVYVKVERGGEVVSRGKVVRGDFIAGNEHWTKGILQPNVVAPEGLAQVA